MEPLEAAPAPVEVKTLSLNEVAEQLGVHYMTVYRHVRTGKLDAVKSNGEWRVAAADIHVKRTPNRGRPGNADIASRQAAFKRRLFAADEPGAWTIMENCLAAGAAPVEIHHQLLIPVMHQIGDSWHSGEIGVTSEHTATAIIMRTVARLGPLMRTKGRSRGSILVGSVQDETHSLAPTIIADLLRNAGFEVTNLGAGTPPESFAEAILTMDQIRAVGLSATMPADDAIASTIHGIRAAAPHLPILVGGIGIQGTSHAVELGADGTENDSRLIIEAFGRLIAAGSELKVSQ